MKVKAPLHLATLLLSICTASIGVSQTYNIEEVGKQVILLNNKKEYDQTILLLEGILADKRATVDDRYGAYFLKYQTYKRLFSYDKADYNLNLALEEGIKGKHKEDVIARVKFEKLFMAFDLLLFDKVNQLLLSITQEDLNRVSATTQGYYYGVLGVLEIKREEFRKAETYFDKATVLLEEHNPANLPMIYRKQIDLYRYLNEYDKSIASFEKGLYYAKKYNTDVYILNMYFDLAHFYKEIGDVDRAVETQEICNQLAKAYDEGGILGRLNVLESKLELQRIEEAKKKDRTIIVGLIGSLFVVIVLLFLLYKYIQKLRKSKVALEEENESLREAILRSVSGMETDRDEMTQLTDRQREIIELVKLGKTNKEIGLLLFVSENTVKYHLKNIYDVLRVSKRVEL